METLLLIPFLKGGATIDGHLNEGAYKKALRITRFYPVFPEDSEPFPGEVFVFHDGSNLYVAFRFQEPHGVRAQSLQRDRLWGNLDDIISIRIGAGSSGYMFNLNPLGVPTDCRIINYDNPICTWDYNWEYHVEKSDSVWWGEIKIPLNNLYLPDTVQFKVVRYATLPDEQGSQQISCTYPTDRSHLIDLRYAHKAVFEGGIHTGKSIPITILPSLTLIHTHPYMDMIYPQIGNTPFHYNAGIDVSTRIDRLSMAATLSPDFAQVEADVGQLNLQKAEIIILPEKRPFFYEGFELFNTAMDILYTRTFVTIRGAAKYTLEGPLKSQGFAIFEDSLGNFYGLSLGLTGRGRNLTGIILHHQQENLSLMDIFYRRLMTGGIRVSLEGNFTNRMEFGYLLRLNRYVSGEGLSFHMEFSNISKDFYFPTVPLPYGPGIMEGSVWASYKKVRGTRFLSTWRIEGAYSRRNLSFGSRPFLNEHRFVETSVLLFSPVYIGYRFYRFDDASGLYSFQFQGPTLRIGSTFDRMIYVEVGSGTLYGSRATSIEGGISYTVGRWKFFVGREMVTASDSTLSRGNTNAKITYRSQRGMYMTLFYQKNVNIDPRYFPEEEGQAIIGYEWGGRSRIFLVFRPFKQNGIWNFQTFFKVTYQVDL